MNVNGYDKWHDSDSCNLLTRLSLNKMAATSQMIIWDAFSWMKSFVFRSRFHWNLFLRVQLMTIACWWIWDIIWTSADPIHWSIYVALRGRWVKRSYFKHQTWFKVLIFMKFTSPRNLTWWVVWLFAMQIVILAFLQLWLLQYILIVPFWSIFSSKGQPYIITTQQTTNMNKQYEINLREKSENWFNELLLKSY